MEDTRQFVFNNVGTVNIYFGTAEKPEISINPEISELEKEEKTKFEISIEGSNNVMLVPEFSEDIYDYDAIFEAEVNDDYSSLDNYEITVAGIEDEDSFSVTRMLALLGEEEAFPGTITAEGNIIKISESNVPYNPTQSEDEFLYIDRNGLRYTIHFKNKNQL